MRIVLDTNILISALFFGGKPKTILDYIVDGKIIAFVSREIIEEYKEVVDRINILKNGSNKHRFIIEPFYFDKCCIRY